MAQFLEAVITELMQENEKISLHQLLFRTSEKLIRGDEFLPEEKKNITDKFLNNISDENNIKCFHKKTKIPKDREIMYPLFFIPSDSPHKRITVTGAMPKTYIFSTNAYELEILRILAMWRFDDESVKNILVKTKDRLKTVCFEQYCNDGEYFETSIAALRFLALVFPDEKQWINKLFIEIINNIDKNAKSAKRSGAVY